MGTNNKNGFTIIELILFFGVAGLLTVAILAGSGMAVAQQRYRDSVHTLRSVLQDQYSEVANVLNDRRDSLTCNSSGVISEAPGGASPRGTSETCVMMGRFIQSYNPDSSTADGEALHIHPVIASMSGSPDPDIISDTEAISQYNLSLHTDRYEERRLEWDSIAQVQGLSGASGHQFSILILRSPLSGSILTYSSSGSTVSNPNSMVNAGNLDSDLTLCIDPAAGGVVTSERMAIRVAANASNQGGVEMLSQEAGSGC